MNFFISPPFGNYLNLPNTIPIKGSYTLEPREGLIPQIFKTLRYSFEYGGWINKIGLRNPGLDYAIQNYNSSHIVSIAILDEKDIPKIIDKIPENMNIELNVSCPNAEKEMVQTGLDKFINNKREWCIIKLSPLCSTNLIDKYYEQGFRQFHCSNTIPIKQINENYKYDGGLSGRSIVNFSDIKIKYINKKYKTEDDDVVIIGGGGVRNWNDVIHYNKKGADHFSASTAFFNPFIVLPLYFNYIINNKLVETYNNSVKNINN